MLTANSVSIAIPVIFSNIDKYSAFIPAFLLKFVKRFIRTQLFFLLWRKKPPADCRNAHRRISANADAHFAVRTQGIHDFKERNILLWVKEEVQKSC